MVKTEASVFVRQKITRIATRVFVMTANGSANIAYMMSIAVTPIHCKATMINSNANPNISDLARLVLQQHKSTVTGSRNTYGIGGGLYLYAKYVAMGIPGKKHSPIPARYNV